MTTKSSFPDLSLWSYIYWCIPTWGETMGEQGLDRESSEARVLSLTENTFPFLVLGWWWLTGNPDEMAVPHNWELSLAQKIFLLLSKGWVKRRGWMNAQKIWVLSLSSSWGCLKRVLPAPVSWINNNCFMFRWGLHEIHLWAKGSSKSWREKPKERDKVWWP